LRLVGIAIAACALACACGNKQADRLPQQCADAVGVGIGTMVQRAQLRIATSQLPDDVRAKMSERSQQLDALAPRLRAVLTNRCVEDRWKHDVIDCYAKITTMEDMRHCRGQLPPEHQAKLQREELDLMAGNTGPPGFGSSAVPAGATPEIAKLEAELRATNDRLNAAVKALADAQSDEQRRAANETMLAVQRDMEAINQRLTAARANAAAPAP